jgi:hypothetical protein
MQVQVQIQVQVQVQVQTQVQVPQPQNQLAPRCQQPAPSQYSQFDGVGTGQLAAVGAAPLRQRADPPSARR